MQENYMHNELSHKATHFLQRGVCAGFLSFCLWVGPLSIRLARLSPASDAKSEKMLQYFYYAGWGTTSSVTKITWMMSSISWRTSSAVFTGSLSSQLPPCRPFKISLCMSKSLATASSSSVRISSSGDDLSWTFNYNNFDVTVSVADLIYLKKFLSLMVRGHYYLLRKFWFISNNAI